MASTINATPTSSGLIQTADNSGVLALQTGGTTAVTIDGSQKVGIGTNTLTNKFNVAGAIQSSSTLVAVEANTVALSQEATYSRLAAFGPNSSTGGTLYLYSISSNGGVQNGAIIDSLGRMTTSAQPAFYAYSSASTVGQASVCAFNATTFNDGNNFNTSNYTFTAPVAGRYYFSACIRYNSNGTTYVQTYIRINSSATLYSVANLNSTLSNSGTYTASMVSGILKLAANDTVTILGQNSAGTTQSISGSESWFMGYLLG